MCLVQKLCPILCYVNFSQYDTFSKQMKNAPYCEFLTYREGVLISALKINKICNDQCSS